MTRRPASPPLPRVAEVVEVDFAGELVRVHVTAPGSALARYRGDYQLFALLAAGLLLTDVDARKLAEAAATVALAELEAAYGRFDVGPVPAGGFFGRTAQQAASLVP